MDTLRARVKGEEWATTVSTAGDSYHVRPTRGALAMRDWPAARGWRSLWGGFGYRDEYPRSEHQLERAIARCDAVCAARNAREAQMHRVLAGRAAATGRARA